MREAALVVVLTLSAVVGAQVISHSGGVDYPEDYRSWSHVKSMIILPGHPLEDPFGGMHLCECQSNEWTNRWSI